MITRSDFFDALAKGALWDVGVAINRTNPLPLDKFSVFGAYSDDEGDNNTTTALGYAKNSVIAYPGQIIAVVDGTNDEPSATVYVIKETGSEAKLIALSTTNDVNFIGNQILELTNNAVTSVTGDKAVKATKAGNAVTLATKTSAVEGNILEIKDDGLYVPTPEAVTVPTYKLKETTGTNSPYAAVYHLSVFNGSVEDTSADTGVDINIPKDKFLKEASIVHYEAGSLPTGVTEAGTYIKFVFENINDPVYLNVKDLIDIYKGGVTDTITVNVDPDTNTITADVNKNSIDTAYLKDGAVTNPKLADDAVTETKIKDGAVTTDKIAAGAVTETRIAKDAVTEGKIKNGAVTLDKLSPEVKISLGKADSAIQSITLEAGKANGTLKLNVDGTAGTEVKVTGLGTAAYKADTAFDTAGAAAAVLGDSTTDTAESNTVHGVKKKAEANTTAITGLQNGKVDKITTGPAQMQLIYGTTKATEDGNFADNWLVASTVKMPGLTTVPMYNDNSRISVGDPETEGDAANKKYVDDAVNTAVSSGVTVETTGEGKYVTAVTKTNGKISVTKSTPAVAITEVTDLEKTLNAKATTEALNQAKADLSGEIIAAQNELSTAIGKKQDALAFEGNYNIETNKVVTKSAMDSAISTATAGLTGAMHYVGESTTLPTGESGATVTGVTAFAKGDVVTYQMKEFVYDGTSWRELGDEGSYAVKGAIKDSDIAADAKIAQSKIDGLTTALAGKVSSARIYGKEVIGPSTFDQALTITNGKLDIPIATDSQFGVTRVVLEKDNGFTYMNSDDADHIERLSIYSVTTDILKNGTKTLILNGGGAAL